MKVSIIVICGVGVAIVVVRRRSTVINMIITTILVHLSGRTIAQCDICVLTHFSKSVSQALRWFHGYEPPHMRGISSEHFTK